MENTLILVSRALAKTYVNGLKLITMLAITLCMSQSVFSQIPSHFYGTIGSFPIEMEITCDNGTINGWYWYPNKSEKLNLHGSLSIDSVFRLKETNSKGVLTGIFDGKFTSGYLSQGKWVSGDMVKEFNFMLKLDNNVSLFTGKKMSLQNDTEGGQEKKMYQPSRIKGYSNLALWTTIVLVTGFVGLLIYLIRIRKKLNNRKVEIQTRIEKEVHYVNNIDSDLEAQIATDKGDMFQKYVVEKFGNKKEYFKWIDATSDKKYGELYPESNMNPDLIIQFNNEYQGWTELFAVECKYRSGQIQNQVYIDEERKITNYKKFKRLNEMETFLILGVGGKADNPKNTFVIPIELVSTIMTIDQLRPYTSNRTYFFFDYNEKLLK